MPPLSSLPTIVVKAELRHYTLDKRLDSTPLFNKFKPFKLRSPTRLPSTEIILVTNHFKQRTPIGQEQVELRKFQISENSLTNICKRSATYQGELDSKKNVKTCLN